MVPAWALLACVLSAGAGPALAEKAGGVLKVYHRDTPPSGSIHEEATNSTVMPYMAVFNNLVMFDQHKPKNSLDTIVPDLAKSWSWNAAGTRLTFMLQEGVSWHDGKPFTAKDVACTFDMLLEKGAQKFRKNPRQSWYTNLEGVTADGELQATLILKRPLLDAIEYTIIKSRATRVLGFIAGEFDMSFDADVTIPLMKDIAAQNPSAVCELVPTAVSRNLIVNRDSPPFDNADLRLALALAIDRSAFSKILQEDGARPILYHDRAAHCWQAKVKGFRMMTNSVYNGWRMEDVWLEQ
jgi:peptide/nickel transport system substrate-binding protein